MAHSEDLRIRLVNKVAAACRGLDGGTFLGKPEFGVLFAKRFEVTGNFTVLSRPPRRRRLDPHGDDILSWLDEMSGTAL